MSARFDDRTIVINLYIRCLSIKRKQRILEKLLWFEHQKKTTDFTKTSYVRFSYVFASGRKYCLFSFLKIYYTKFFCVGQVFPCMLYIVRTGFL